jgi:hypothetical protein
MFVRKGKSATFRLVLAVVGAGLVSFGLQAADEASPAKNPSAGEIWSAKPQNDLLRRILKHKLNKARSPTMSPETLKHINLTDSAAHGNVGLLKDGGKLKWPEALAQPAFDKVRARLAKNLRIAVDELKHNDPLGSSRIKDMKADLKELNKVLTDNLADLPVTRYIEAKRYLNQLSEAIRALSDKSAIKHFNGTWAPRGKNIAELVSWMSKQGLIFAPAVPGDEATYNSLYIALRDYEAALRSADK